MNVKYVLQLGHIILYYLHVYYYFYSKNYEPCKIYYELCHCCQSRILQYESKNFSLILHSAKTDIFTYFYLLWLCFSKGNIVIGLPEESSDRNSGYFQFSFSIYLCLQNENTFLKNKPSLKMMNKSFDDYIRYTLSLMP